MQKTGNKAAFAKLREYEKRSLTFKPGEGRGEGHTGQWAGVTFQLGESRLSCHIDRINEILPSPAATPVPGAKPWILGLANVRGALLTIVDLGWFLKGERSQQTSRSRLLSINLQKAPVGLLIDEVFGQRHFLDNDSTEVERDPSDPLNEFLGREYTVGSETWQSLDIDRLFNKTEFLNGSAI